MSDPRVSIIIPTLFPPNNLSEVVTTLSTYQNVSEVIVVSNGPIIDLVQISNVKSIRLPRNLGFAGACNAGALQASSDLLLFLNDDCVLGEEALISQLQYLDMHPNLVATQPVVYDTHSHIENIGFLIDTRIGKAEPIKKIPSLDPLLPGTSQIDIFPLPFVYGLSGTCLLIKRSTFLAVGMFDASFHSYLEDIDLAVTLVERGLNVLPCTLASVTHHHMNTSRKMPHYKQWRDMENWWRIILKHPNIFVKWYNLPKLLLERGRNLSGLLKSYLSKYV